MKPSILANEMIHYVTPEWRSFRDILWEFNGPRERPIIQSEVKAAMGQLVRRKLVETKTSKRIHGQYGFYAGDNSAYRLKAQ